MHDAAECIVYYYRPIISNLDCFFMYALKGLSYLIYVDVSRWNRVFLIAAPVSEIEVVWYSNLNVII